MGGATARGLAIGQHINTQNIYVSNPSRGKLEAIKAEFPQINITQDNKECVREADMIIIAVKPWKLEELAKEIAPELKNAHSHRGQALRQLVRRLAAATA